jgi:NAD(P)-dependent dehydrogenase (short-subunit alcohol dehydrogenase family)
LFVSAKKTMLGDSFTRKKWSTNEKIQRTRMKGVINLVSNHWNTTDIPDQSAKIVVITGANSGIGFAAAKAMAEKGARVIFACRSQERGSAAVRSISSVHPSANVELILLDLADLASVHAFASEFSERYDSLDILINNAGLMALPRSTTADGFEMQFGVNHLGHFALTGLLMNRLLAADRARIVNVSSALHLSGVINFDDLNGESSYNKWSAYSQSKLANLLFAFELNRRLEKNGYDAISVGCHPGYAATNLQAKGPEMSHNLLLARIMTVGNRLFAQSAEKGALPTLYAAAAPDVNGCDYIGPDSLMGQRGYPKKIFSSSVSYAANTAARLWQVSEELTGVYYDLLKA